MESPIKRKPGRILELPHNANVDERYGKPTRYRLPALVVLAGEGKQLTTQDTGKLGQSDPAYLSVSAFPKDVKQ